MTQVATTADPLHSRVNLPPKLVIAKKEDTSASLIAKNLPVVPHELCDYRERGIAYYTPEKIRDILKDLNDCKVNATFVSKGINDQGKVLRTIQEIQDALSTRKEDIDFYLTRVSSPYSGSPATVVALSPTSPDPSPTSLSKGLFEFQRCISVLNEKLKSYRLRPTLFLNAIHRRNRLLDLASLLHDAWMNLLIELSLSISRASSEAASSATGNISRLAVATGTEDWSDLSIDDAKSFYMQAEKYYLGYGVPRSFDLAYKRYYTAAKLGLPEAATMLGIIYENGQGKTKDLAQAITWYTTAATLNYPEALNHLGRLHEQGKGCKVDVEKAFGYYKKGAALGHLDSITNYASLLQLGRGCDQDLKLAFEQLVIAADKDYARAQNALGNCYYLGKGTDIDYTQAVKWFKKASEQGYPCAHNNMGICCEEGQGVAKDLVAAKSFYSLAAELGHPNGTNNLAYMYLLERQYQEALKLFNVALSLGSTDAAYNLGTMYEAGCSNAAGTILNRDLDSALRYYKEAADKGCIKSQLRLATLQICSPPPIQNYSNALKYLLMVVTSETPFINSPLSTSPMTETFFLDTSVDQTCQKEKSDAQNLIGELLELGQGTEEEIPDPTTAAMWYKRSMRLGHARATFNLAALYENGVGVPRDLERALKLYEEADKRGSLEARERLEEYQEIDMMN